MDTIPTATTKILLYTAPEREQLTQALNKPIAYNEKLGDEGVQYAVNTIWQAVIGQISIAVIVISVVFIIGLFILRNIMQCLGGEPSEVAKITNQIAQVNTSISI